MKRRDFLKTSVIASAALSLNFEGLQAALSTNTVAVEKAPDMVAVMGGEPEVMLDKALEALGGIGNFVKKGQMVKKLEKHKTLTGRKKAAKANQIGRASCRERV